MSTTHAILERVQALGYRVSGRGGPEWAEYTATHFETGERFTAKAEAFDAMHKAAVELARMVGIELMDGQTPCRS